jgi:hypothetical protein
MSAPAATDEPFEVIHLGGVEAAIVPIDELRRLRAIARHASPEAIEKAELEEAEEILAQHRAWVAEGCQERCRTRSSAACCSASPPGEGPLVARGGSPGAAVHAGPGGHARHRRSC